MAATGTDRPYATIIIPTHDRASTLPHALESARGQTVREIEILVVGDGCTPAVRTCVERFIESDPRIRFMDLPKAPLRGAANRDLAVRSARSPRIFYSDDDDLMLPHHVEILGQTLDHVDVVDTPAVSVLTSGRVALGSLDSAHPLQRRLLVEERFKGVFDTHLAHRRSVYLDRGSAWTATNDHRVVLHMLKAFAADPTVTWRTLPRITALSFHGARRVTMTSQARAAELEQWSRRIGRAGLEADLRRTAGYSQHALPLLQAARGESDGPELLRSTGLVSASRIRRRPGIGIRDKRRRALMAEIALLDGVTVDSRAARDLLDEMLEPMLGPTSPVAGIIKRFTAIYGARDVEDMLAGLSSTPGVELGRLYVQVLSGQPCDEDSLRQTHGGLPPEDQFWFGLAVMQAFAVSDPDASWNWAEVIKSDVPDTRHAVDYWTSRRDLAIHLSYQVDAAHADARRAVLSARLT